MTPLASLPNDVADALHRGDAMEAIRLLRGSKGVGLPEAVQIVEAYRQRKPATRSNAPKAAAKPVPSTLQAMTSQASAKPARQAAGLSGSDAARAAEMARLHQARSGTGLSPGEVRRTPGIVRWLIVLAALGYAVYRHFGA